MKVKAKIFIVLIIMLVFLNSSVYALDMFLDSSSLNNTTTIGQYETVEENNLNNVNTNYNYTSQEPQDETSAPTITSTVKNNSLTISDIIDIVLIAVCIVLILLAIAILIRCK